jgi:hypothetical protein
LSSTKISAACGEHLVVTDRGFPPDGTFRRWPV